MQTFLPYPDPYKTAKVLDFKRLGKQRIEAMQIINTLEHDGGWKYHPAVLMWRGYVPALKIYFNIILREWISRGYESNMIPYNIETAKTPPWISDERVHRSHRSRLIQKDPKYYGPLFPDTPNNLNYYWPVPRR